MQPTTFEQFLGILRSETLRRGAGFDLSNAEAARIVADPALARAYYANWIARQPPAPRPPAAPRAKPKPVPRSSLDQSPMLVVGILGSVLSLVALGPWPYAYYVFLRWFLAITAVLLGYYALRDKRNRPWLAVAIPILILWAPGAFVIVERGVWAVLNVAAAVALVLAGLFITGPHETPTDEKPRWHWWQSALLAFGIGAVFTYSALTGDARSGCDIVGYDRTGAVCG